MIPADDGADAAALGRCQEGDISGLDVLVARYQTAAVRIAYLLTQNQGAAEDIVQDSFLLVYRGRQQFHTGAPFAPWFYRIVLNTARQHMRTIRRRKENSLDALPHEMSSTLQAPAEAEPAASAESAERRSTTLEILQMLTVKQRETLVLRYFNGNTDSEIARILGVPSGTVRWRLHSALRAFERIARRTHPWLIEREKYESHGSHEHHESALTTMLLQAEGDTSR